MCHVRDAVHVAPGESFGNWPDGTLLKHLNSLNLTQVYKYIFCQSNFSNCVSQNMQCFIDP
jgi:hypothetical protein